MADLKVSIPKLRVKGKGEVKMTTARETPPQRADQAAIKAVVANESATLQDVHSFADPEIAPVLLRRAYTRAMEAAKFIRQYIKDTEEPKQSEAIRTCMAQTGVPPVIARDVFQALNGD